MSLPKPVITAALAAWLSLACAYGIVQSVRDTGPLVSWLGLVLCASGPLLFLLGSRLSAVQRTRRSAFAYSVVCGLGLALTLAMSYRYGPAAGSAHVWAGITLLAWLVYLRWSGGAAKG